MANLMLSIMGAFAEFERALIRERQREGIALAKQRGAYRGRKKMLAPNQVDGHALPFQALQPQRDADPVGTGRPPVGVELHFTPGVPSNFFSSEVQQSI